MIDAHVVFLIGARRNDKGNLGGGSWRGRSRLRQLPIPGIPHYAHTRFFLKRPPIIFTRRTATGLKT